MKINEKNIDANLCILPESQEKIPYYLEGATILMKLSSMKMTETRSQKNEICKMVNWKEK